MRCRPRREKPRASMDEPEAGDAASRGSGARDSDRGCAVNRTVDIAFVANIIPIGKGRARATVRADGHAGTYTPGKTRRWEATFAAIAERHAPPAPIDEPIAVDILAVFPRPKRLLRKSSPRGMLWLASKPDIDNVFKIVTDAMSR